jgi:hypothetical protein
MSSVRTVERIVRECTMITFRTTCRIRPLHIQVHCMVSLPGANRSYNLTCRKIYLICINIDFMSNTLGKDGWRDRHTKIVHVMDLEGIMMGTLDMW